MSPSSTLRKVASPPLERIDELPEVVETRASHVEGAKVQRSPSQRRGQAPGRGARATSRSPAPAEHDPFRLRAAAKHPAAATAKASPRKNGADADLRATNGGKIARTKIDKGKAAKTKTVDPRLLTKGIKKLKIERLWHRVLSGPSLAQEGVNSAGLRYKPCSA